MRKTGGRRPGSGRKPKGDWKPELLDRLAAFVHQHLAETGFIPTVVEMSVHMDCAYATASGMWQALVQTKRVSRELAKLRERQKNLRKCRSRHLPTGKCTAEMADKICHLLKHDAEARASFFELLRGNRKEPLK